MKKHLVIKKDGITTIHYLRPYIGILPVGFKVISEVFQKQENGNIIYKKYSEDGSHLVQEGVYRLNSQTDEMYKVGTWKYFSRTFKYHPLLLKEEIYTEKGQKIEEKEWNSNFKKSVLWKNGIIIENTSMYGVFREQIITDISKGTRDSQVSNYYSRALVRRTIEKGFDKKKGFYRYRDVLSYDLKTGHLVRCERRIPNLRDMYIIENYPDGNPSFFEYAEKRYGRYMTLFSSQNKKEVYRYLLLHLKLAKKDCTKRQLVIEVLRKLPDLKVKKVYLKAQPFIQPENYRGG